MTGWPSFLDWVGELKGQMATMRVFHRAVCSFSKHCCQPAFTLCPFYSFQPSIAFRNKVYGQSRAVEKMVFYFPLKDQGCANCCVAKWVMFKSSFFLSLLSRQEHKPITGHTNKQKKKEKVWQQWLVVVCKGLVNGSCPFWNSLFFWLCFIDTYIPYFSKIFL